MASKVGTGIALPFHDRGIRRGWVVSSTPQSYFAPGKDPIPIVQEAVWAPGPVWTAENLAPPGFDLRTVQPVVSRYTDWATWPTFLLLSSVYSCLKFAELNIFPEVSHTSVMHPESWVRSHKERPLLAYYSKDGIRFEVLLFFVMTSSCCLASQGRKNIVLTCMVVGPFRHSETAEMWVRS
jgi:hypothetical protein